MLGVLADLETIHFYKLIINDNIPNFSKITFKIISFEALTMKFREFNLQLSRENQTLNKNNIENLC